ncbi:signal recognition particle-docking protein FtsY [Fructobacillus fructosus]|uniref:Signal recognition particle receptor FtsY n=1 Tax=Fructobacillus fructosus TaxID=1631 RepID=A0ABM9MY34_9LACO|nr:signal recognition particle-docking protein FtsY [Fructobacillus fructosus]MBD9364908.1 signal recognition particle-docking protein FtsY [Leuconostoc mesenteroides]KRN51850.1 signal recognition particle-docking protein FtsY [Fructobacillus fructosus KCTC 3544]MBC9118431.1 signal recognition particle-docking protein FtsY [Fructobacillus fructosus]CAK1229492.1 Signal recognition particle GTPase FtsY (FtsY) [Fructobacillus fructosus]CAK1248334.1 Signal recognition particle GTPase FtsY (FtsY) [
MGLFDIFKKKKQEEPVEAEAPQSAQPEDATAKTDSSANQEPEASVAADETVTVNQAVVVQGTDGAEEAVADEEDSLTLPEDNTDGNQVAEKNQTNEQSIDETERYAESEVVESNETVVDDEVKHTEAAEDKTESATDDNEQAVYEKGLTQSRKGFASRFNKFLANFRSVDEEFFEDLEDTLIGADLGFDLAIQISDQVREEAKLENLKSKEDIRELIIRIMVESYEEQGKDEDQNMHFAPAGQPTVVLFVGVNGVGKTTTVGKMAQRYKDQGKKIMLAAADTFRAGAVKQLQEWGERAQVPVVTGPEKADPSSVVYQAVERAKAEQVDMLFVDTAGRLQNNVNLMQELAKMNRVVKKVLPDAPQEVLLVLDATTGQNALQQAKLFKDSSEVTGLVLTKMDGTAKGGIVFAIRDQLHLPVKWIGFGEKASDLRVFSAEDFVYGLFKDLVKS